MTPDAVFTFANMDVFWLLLAFAGGAFAAMIGPNFAFAFTGVSILVGFSVTAATGNTMFLDYISFGPVFGPHIAFAGGVGASTYAAKKGLLPDGARDINSPLAGLNRPDVLLVGALYGVGGYVLHKLIVMIPWFGTHTDSVALTVVTSGIVARLMFGKTPVFHLPTRPEGSTRWLDWQEKPLQLLTISGFASLMAAGIATIIVGHIAPVSTDPQDVINNAQVVPFAISALCIFFVAAGKRWPVTHHMTITAGLAAVLFFPITGSGVLAVLIGTVFGIIAGFGGELVARVFYAHGDTHIDPPAGIIWFMNTLVVVSAGLFA